MAILELNEGTLLGVSSNYDAGRHTGFVVGTTVKGSYCDGKRLDELLTKEQIRALEYILLVSVYEMVEESDEKG